MLHKTFDLLETKTDSETGTFEATVAVFGNVDRGGDRIMPGAFKNTLVKWAESGDPIPVILSHQWDNPMAHIGVVNEAKETDKGLWVKGTLDIGDNDVARQVHRLMKRRSLKEFSFGYEVAKNGSKRAKDGALDLTDLDLAEVGPTLKGMNPSTELYSVKTAINERIIGALAEQTKALREESERRARDVADESVRTIKTTLPAPGTEPKEPERDLVKELEEVKARLAAAETALNAPEDTEALRKESLRLAREIAEARIPELNVQLEEPAEPEVDLFKELEEVKALVVEMRQGLEDLKKKTEETDKGQHARSVDPLRKRSEDLALEIASGGMSLRKPPAPVTSEPEHVDLDALKRQSRDWLFETLSYSTE
jgi:HK97 family phage prohead protease